MSEDIKAENYKYTATIQRMSNSLALTFWDQIPPDEQKRAWMTYTKPYWVEMAKAAYHVEHHPPETKP